MDDSLPSASISFAPHIINAAESDFMIECVDKFKRTIVDMANERSSEANAARLETWAQITEMFNNKFDLDVSTKALKSNLSYRQGKLKRNATKYKMFRDWLSNPSKSEEDVEKEIGRGDFILLRLFGEDMEKPPQKRKLDESENSSRIEWNSTENEESQGDLYFLDVEPKEEFDPDQYEVREESRTPSEPPRSKRSRISPPAPPPSLPQRLPTAPSSFPVAQTDEESALRMELLRAQIQLTKTQQNAAEKQIQANAAMIMMMDRLMERIEKKKDDSDQSSVTNLISIMKEMVKK